MYRVDKLTTIELGVELENQARVIEIDVSEWLKKWPNAAFEIAALRPGEDEPYLANTTLSGNLLKWKIGRGDVGKPGLGRCDIRAYEGSVVAKTAVAVTIIQETLPGTPSPNPPSASQSWVDTVAGYKADAITAKNGAEAAKSKAEEAQGKAEEAQRAAETAKAGAEEAKQAAEAAKAGAESAKADTLDIASGIHSLTAEAETLPPGSDAEAAYNGQSGVLTIGVPRGFSGVHVGSGEMPEGCNVQIDPTGSAAVLVRADKPQNLTDAQKAQARENIGYSSDVTDEQVSNHIYQGIDLSEKFSGEIAGYQSKWTWIKARIASGNFAGMRVGDYLPFTTTNGRTFHAQIAGINTYKGYGDSEVGNHIDFITRELWPDAFQMNPVNFNNGTSSDKQVPWLASNGYLFVNSLAGQVPNSDKKPLEMVDVDYTAGGMYLYLPDDIKEVIVEKRVWAQTRFSDSGILTNDNSAAWVNIGKLWLPDEYEVTGARLMTSIGWFNGGYAHYPIFAHSMNRLKKANGSRGNWWTSSAYAGGKSTFVRVYHTGIFDHTNASNATRAPFCFRVSA